MESQRPQFHFSVPSNWLNDPNGLVYFEGEYHLFYQYHPYDIVWGPMHWGHAISKDLVHWEHLPIALYPDKHGTIYSGTVVVDSHNSSSFLPDAGLLAVFSYDNQSQGVAYSSDKGRTWIKYEGNPIMPALAQDFRDPKIFWHSETQSWVMIISAGKELQFYTSRNLLEWEFASRFWAGEIARVWEVPDIFPMMVNSIKKWLIIVSLISDAPAGGSGTRYFIGDFDGKTFTNDYPDEILWFDWGSDNYAGTTWNNEPNGEHLFIGWMNNWAYAKRTPASTWRGMMTIPRKLELIDTAAGYRLRQMPIEAIANLRQNPQIWKDLLINTDSSLDVIQGDTLEIIAEFELETARSFGIEIAQSEQKSTIVSYDVAGQKLSITRPDIDIDDYPTQFSAPLRAVDNQLRLRLLIDRCSLEVFANDGILAMTAQIYPASATRKIKLFAQQGQVKISELTVYALASIL